MRLLIIFLCLTGTCAAQSVMINEVMSLNISILSEEDNDYPDWIELYNPTHSAINLLDYGLSDDKDEPSKWLFPDVTISAGEFLVVYASDKDRQTPNSLHTNFKIKSKGEKIVLATPTGTIVDSLSIPPLAVDISYGRNPDGDESWAYYVTPTPNQENNTEPAGGHTDNPQFSHSGGLYSMFNISPIFSLLRTGESSFTRIHSPLEGMLRSLKRYASSTPFK